MVEDLMRLCVWIPLAMLLVGSLQGCRNECSAPSSLEPGHDLPSLGCGDYSLDLPGSESEPTGPDDASTGGAQAPADTGGSAGLGELGGEGGAE